MVNLIFLCKARLQFASAGLDKHAFRIGSRRKSALSKKQLSLGNPKHPGRAIAAPRSAANRILDNVALAAYQTLGAFVLQRRQHLNIGQLDLERNATANYGMGCDQVGAGLIAPAETAIGFAKPHQIFLETRFSGAQPSPVKLAQPANTKDCNAARRESRALD